MSKQETHTAVWLNKETKAELAKFGTLDETWDSFFQRVIEILEEYEQLKETEGGVKK